MDLAERISKLSSEQRKLLELKLKQQDKGIDVLHIPITKENRQNLDHFPLSFGQERLWFIDQLEPGNPAYNIVRVTKLEGNLDKNALKKSINEMIRRHEILRTLFAMTDGKPEQVILPTLTIPLTLIDLKNLETGQQALKIKQVIERESRYPFDLAKGPLLRTHLLELNPDNYLFLLVIHHIVSDGTSVQVFIREVVRFYEAFSNGGGVPGDLPPLPIQYVDYACWQRQWLQGGETDSGFIKKQGDYWLNEFSGDIPVLTLPTDYSRPAMRSFEGSIVYFNISVEETKALNWIVSREKTTLYILLLALYNIFLSKLSGMEDIIVGTPVAGRRHPSLQHMIGMFVNTLALRNYPGSDKGFGQFLQEIKNRTLKAFENQEYRYEDIIAKAAVNRDTSRNPLFDVMFLLKNLDYAEVNLPGLTLRPWDYEQKTAMFDLTLSASEEGDRLQFSFDYSTKLFHVETIERFINYFKQLVDSVVELSRGNDFDVRISDIEIIPPEERKKILADFNNTGVDYPWTKTIHELIEEQVEKTPDHIALIFEDKRLSYKELNGRSNQLARFLRARGVKAGSIVGIVADRSLELLVAIFSVLKAGGVYLPLDPTHPAERVKYMLKASHAAIVLTNNQLLANDEFALVDLNDEENYKNESSDLSFLNSPVEPAYVIYTSGTTGIPKGVVIENRSFVNFIKGMTEVIDFRVGDRILSLTTVSFDIFGLETLVPLTRGPTVVMGNNEEQMDPGAAASVIERQKITILQVTPSRLQLLLSSDEAAKQLLFLRYLLVGGEAFPERLLEQVRPLVKGKIYNVYGPTETTVWSTVKDLSGDACLNIGKPIANTVIHILDRYLKPVPIGVVGEIYIGGDGVARGYLNNPELTAERFIEFHRSYRSYISYRTGDLGRWLPDGDIECFGRVDHQVKIRGFRIEMGEIESHLKKHEKVRDAVVVARKDKRGGKYLCAYIVTTIPGGTLSPADLKIYLSDKLPDYMVPQFFQSIESISLNASGKVDRKKLPEPEILLNREYIGPRNRIEQALVDIWAEVLHVDKEKISINDNFFNLGGHSLNATVLASLMHEKLNVKIPLAQIFKTPFIGRLSEHINEILKNKHAPSVSYTPIEPVEEREYYPLSPSQKRMYILNLFVDYRISLAFEIDGALDRNRFEQVCQELVNRHESLRTSFHEVEGEAVQKIQDRMEFIIDYYDSGNSDSLVSQFFHPFDLSRPPLIRMGLIRLLENKHLFLINMHHLVLDGVSVRILSNEFIRLYRGEELPELKVRYRDFSQWQNRQLQGEVYRKQEAYWLKVYSEEVPVLNLPTDYLRPAMQRFEGGRVRFQVAGEMFQALKQLAITENASLYMVLLAVYFTLLFRYTGQEDIVTGTISAGRQQREIQNLIGIFINPIAIRSFPAKVKTFKGFLQELKLNTLDAFENQLYPFGDLLEKVVKKKDFSRNPLFDVMLIFQNRVPGTLEIEELRFSLYPLGAEHGILDNAQQDITLWAYEEDDQIRLDLEYCTALFKHETMERFAGHFLTLLRGAEENPELKLSEIEIITDKERQQILLQFNDTEKKYPSDKTIHQLFEEQAARTGDRIAVVSMEHGVWSMGAYLTYGELNKRANQLAQVLKNKGVMPDIIVGIMLERSVAMIIAVAAVLKAGGAYLPLDTNYPGNRITYMLENSSARVLLSEVSMVSKVSGWEGETVFLEDWLSEVSEVSGEIPTQLTHLTHPTQLCYVIYTSGSTGRPKGVMVQHVNFVNAAFAWRKEYRLDEIEGNLLQMASFSFDVFAGDFARVFINGGKMVICPQEILVDPPSLYTLIRNQRITLFEATPSLVVPLMEYVYENQLAIGNLQLLIAGSDSIGVEDFKRLMSRFGDRMRIINSYGVTEATIDTSYYEESIENIPLSGNVPIGKPMPNMTFLILDPHGNLQPIGIPGELYIGGRGVALGYLNDPELTNSKFQIPNSSLRFSASQLLSFSLYRTGDLVRWLPDGNVEFLGRIDYQVKIRGFRIEIKEIETQLITYHQIKEAVVVEREDENGSKYLCAYIVPSEEKENNTPFTVSELRAYLSGVLPDYMIPSHFVEIDEIPLTPNGKIDTNALLALEGGIEIGIEYVAPTDEVEKKLADLWAEILEKDRVGIYDNFFNLGGHSILAMRVVSKIQDAFQVKIPLIDFFRLGTIRGIAGKIKDLQTFASPEVGEPDTKRRDLIQPFDLSRAPLMRAALIKLKSQRHLLFLDMHHIISDAVSTELFAHEFTQIYTDRELPPLPIQYKDFAQWEEDFAVSEEYRKQEEYWLNNFKDPVLRLELPLNFPRPVTRKREGKTIYTDLGAELAARVRDFAASWEVTLYMLLLATYNILLARNSGQEDIVVGTPVSGRTLADLNPLLGMFVNTLAMRNFPRGHLSFLEFLEDVRTRTLQALENQDYQFEKLVEKLNLSGDANRNPLFDTFFAVEDVFETALLEDDRGFTVTALDPGYSSAMFDLVVRAVVGSDDIKLCFSYDIDLFKEATVQNMLEQFINLLKWILYQPDFLIREIDMTAEPAVEPQLPGELTEDKVLTDCEREQILVEFNNTAAPYPTDKTIHKLFEEQAKRTPDRIAVVGSQHLTYRQLDKKSHQLTQLLRKKGVKPDTVVAIMMDRSIEMVIGMLGILKTGGAYLPINPNHPKERITYILADSAVKALLTNLPEERHLFNSQLSIVNYQLSMINPATGNRGVQPAANSSNLAYIIYTSGTTGKPKGVMIQHRSVVNVLTWFGRQYHLKPAFHVLQLTGYDFDPSVEQIFGTLLHGAVLHMVDQELAADINSLRQYIEKHQVNIVNFVPHVLDALVGYGKKLESLEFIISGGERLDDSVKNRIIKKGYALYNHYGPTEITIEAITGKMSERPVYLGKPLANVQCYILDKSGAPAPLGVTGELCIAGDGLARGYLNNLELTAEKFSRSYKSYRTYILYKTGDLARWLPDGNIDFLGRVDHQLKIRGFRIELSEVESVLLKHPQVREAAVVDKLDSSGVKYLSAYFAGDGEFTVKALRVYLLRSLPEYMVPVTFFKVAKIPLTDSGKLDRRALARLEVHPVKIDSEYAAPRNELERKLAAIWAGVLKMDRVGLDDHFYELGGDSLRANQATARVNKELNTHVSVKDLLTSLTLRAFGKIVARSVNIAGILLTHTRIVPVEKKEYYPVSSVQKRQFVLHQLNKEDVTYNIPSALILEGNINRQKLAETFNTIIQRHESLRTAFDTVDGEIVQKVYDRVNFEITLYESGGEDRDAAGDGIDGIIKGEVDFRPLGKDREIYGMSYSIEALEKKEYYALSSAQKRLYFLQQMDLESTAYNVPKVIPLHMKMDKGRLVQTFKKLIERHESLRSSFPVVCDEPVQRIHKDVVFELESHVAWSTEHGMPPASFVRPFDLTQVPLLRVGLIKEDEENHFLMLDMHHIITDEISQDILTNDFMALYAGKELPPLLIQYKDYAQWHNREMERDEGKKQEEYWLKEFEGDIPLLNLPTDYVRPEILGFKGDAFFFTIEPVLTGKIKKHAARLEVTLMMYLLAVYNILLSKYTGQEDIVVGTVIAGRNHKELEDIIGFFVNMLAIRTRPNKNKTFTGFLSEVKEKAVKAFENQDYQFEELVGQLDIQRHPGRHPLVDTVFVLQDVSRHGAGTGAADSSFGLYQVSHFDLLLHATVASDSIHMVFEYSTDLFKKSTIEEFSNAYAAILSRIVENQNDIRLQDIQIDISLLAANKDPFRGDTDDWDI